MKLFNAFQITVLFACMPFIIGWLGTAPFAYSGAAYWIAIVTYVAMFGMMVGSVFAAITDWKI